MSPQQPRPPLSRANVEQTDTLVVVGDVTALSPEACGIVTMLVEAGLKHLAERAGGMPTLPPGAGAVVAAVRAGAQRWRGPSAPALVAVVAERNPPPQPAQVSGAFADAPDDELSTGDAAARWRVSPAHVRNLAARGQLPARRGPRGGWVLERSFVTSHRTVADAVTAHTQDTEKAAA